MALLRKKSRGQKRKLAALINNIDRFKAYENTNELYEHFHVPCAYSFIDSPKTGSKVKTKFLQKWIEVTEKFINQKPENLKFCKVVSLIIPSELWSSQIIIFYDEDYYNSFRERNMPEQTWTKIETNQKSFVHERGIRTSLKEVCYVEEINENDFYGKRLLWFYGEL